MSENNKSTFETPCIRFDEQMPSKQDRDLHYKIMVYKPQGWPEFLTPQYRGAQKLILAENGYWSKMKWDQYEGCSFDHQDWRKRILHTHWKVRDEFPDTYVFTQGRSVDPDWTGMYWDTYDWTGITELVERARELIELGQWADPFKVWSVYRELLQWVGKEDQFMVQWYNAMRRHGWPKTDPMELTK